MLMPMGNSITGMWEEFALPPPNTQMTKDCYGKTCDYLAKFTPTIFGLFHWFGADADDERVCTLQYLGYKLHRALGVAMEIYNKRGLMIRDERCEVFKRFLGSNNNCVKNIEKFINSADILLKRAFDENSSLLDFGKKRLISKFIPLMEWVNVVRNDSNLKKLAIEKCEEWELNHMFSFYDDVSGVFRQQTYALLDSMILLSIPCHATASFNDFVTLYQNTLHVFCQSEKWLTNRDYLEAQINDEYDDKELTTKMQKERHLKEKYHILRIAKEEYLKRFGIKSISINSDWGKAHLGQKLYERLNNIHLSSDEDGEFTKMTDADLETYLTIEAQMLYVTNKIVELKREKDGQSTIFLGVVDEEIMSDCLYEVYQKFFGENACLKLSGKYNDETALASFLFMTVEKDQLVKSNFSQSGKKPFYEFLKNESKIPLDCTEKTFYNRLKKDFGAFYMSLMAGKLTMLDIKSDLYSDFQLVRKTFHGTQKHHELKRWKEE